MKSRRARPSDAGSIAALIAQYAAQGSLLPRTEENIRGHIPAFLVLEEKGEIVGCVSLESYGADLAEVRSLAVNSGNRGRGGGTKLLQYALREARRRKIARVFAVTHAPEFFERQGFAASSRRAIPEKIVRDCSACTKARRCRLVAVVATLLPEGLPMPILDNATWPLPVA